MHDHAIMPARRLAPSCVGTGFGTSPGEVLTFDRSGVDTALSVERYLMDKWTLSFLTPLCGRTTHQGRDRVLKPTSGGRPS